MPQVTFWLQFLLLVLILKQSDAAAYQSGELREEIDGSEEDMTNTTELKHNNGEEAINCCACQTLLEAARSGELNTVKNLTKCCKDNCTDSDYTPLLYAAANGHVEVVRVLLESGANTERAKIYGWTALHTAAMKGNLKVCSLLLDWGATVDPLDIRKHTPLHLAVMWRHLLVVKLLLERGADINSKSEFGDTALHFAVLKADLSMVKLLVEWGEDVTWKNNMGLTGSDLARNLGRQDVAKLLDSVLESMSHDVDTEACNGTATDCLTTSVRSQKQTAILESGQQQGVQTAAVDPTENLDLVSKEEEKDCGPEENACRSLPEATRSGGVDRAKGLMMCGSSDKCTDGSSFPVTPPTDGLHQVHVDIASNNSRLRDRLAEMKVSGNSTVRKAPAVMSNDYEQIAKESEEPIAKEFEEQTRNKFVDKFAKEFQNQTTRDDVWRKVLEDQTASDVWRKVLEDQKVSDVRRKVHVDQTTSDDGQRKVLEDESLSGVGRKVLEDQTASDVRRKVLDHTTSEVWRKLLEHKTASYDGRRMLLEDQTASNVRRKVLEDQTASDDVRSKVLDEHTAIDDVKRKVLED